MNNQEIFDMLSSLEEALYYKLQNPEGLEPFWSQLAEIHREAKTMLCQWHNLTGCNNQ